MEETELVYCNKCEKHTNHTIKASIDKSVHTPEDTIDDIYQILECLGCENTLFRRRYMDSNIQDIIEEIKDETPGYEIPEYSDKYYPPLQKRKKPVWINRFLTFNPISEAIEEVYSAWHNNLLFLASMGIRTIIDLLCCEKIGDVGNFTEKLNGLQDKKFITEREKKRLSTVVEMGNAAAHRASKRSSEEIEQAMDIIEDMLEKIYVRDSKEKKLDDIAKQLEKGTPKRKKTKRKKTKVKKNNSLK